MFNDVKKAWKVVEDRVKLDCNYTDFSGLSKEEKIDICDEAIIEFEALRDDVETVLDTLYDYQSDLEE